MAYRNKSLTFGSLLSAAISYIAACENKTVALVEDELGEKLEVSGKTIQRYKTGILPPQTHGRDTIRILAEAIVTRPVGALGRIWLERFLQAARYPAAERLLAELCPLPASGERPERIYENLPAPTYTQFVMREQAFANVIDGLCQRTAAVLIVGMGGNGKTSLAREVATLCVRKTGDAPHFDAIVWVSDSDRPGTTNHSTVLDTIARTLDYPGFTKFTHDEKLYEVEQLLRRQKVLLIIDNAETITDRSLFDWLLRIPEPSKSIITTRERNRWLWGSWPVELRGMDDVEARTLLQQQLTSLRIAQMVRDPRQLNPVVEATGGNPKAITMVAGLLKHERRPLETIIEDLRAARGDLFHLLFDRAWELLDDAARRILMVMTFFPDSASIEALSASANVAGFDLDRARERLADLSLLDIQQDDLAHAPRYLLHPLVRAFASARLAEQPAFEQQARERWGTWYRQLASQVGWCWNDHSKLALLDLEHGNLFAVLEWAYTHAWYAQIVQLCQGAEYFYYVRGLWDKKLALNIIHASAAHTVQDYAEESRALSFHVYMLSRQGKLDEAKIYLSRLHEIEHSVDLPGDNYFWIQHANALYWFVQDDYEQAYQHWRKSLEYAQPLSIQTHINASQWIGSYLYRAGKIAEAQHQLQTTLETSIKHGYIRGVVHCQHGLALNALHQGDVAQAEAALVVCQTHALQYQDREYLAAIRRLSARLHLMNEHDAEAYAAFSESMDIFERLGMRREWTETHAEREALEARISTSC